MQTRDKAPGRGWLALAVAGAVQLGIIAQVLAAPSPNSIQSSKPPASLSLQGILTDSGGDPVPDGVYDLTFGYYDSEIGGSPLATEMLASVPVTQGRFAIDIGNVSVLIWELPSDLWLGVQIGAEPELAPRIRLTGAPRSAVAFNVRDSTITGPKIAPGSICSDHVADDCLESADLRDEPGVAYQEDIFPNTIEGPPELLTSRVINIPAPGYVLAVGSAQVNLKPFGCDPDVALPYTAKLSVSLNASLHDDSNAREVEVPCAFTNAASKVLKSEATVQDVFYFSTAGAKTIYFLASAPNESGTGGLITSPEHNLLLMYVSTAYGTIDVPAGPARLPFGTAGIESDND